MFTTEEIGNVITAKLNAYSGETIEFKFDKEEGHSFEIGGTASNQVHTFPVKVLSVYTREENGKEYCDVQIGRQLISGQRVCGVIVPHQTAFLIETYDLNDNPRWLVVKNIPEALRRHFINIDVRAGSALIKRLRIDPFLGESKVM